MKSKVKKLFSKFSVKAYDYPFIVGFIEAKGINDVVPTIDMNSRMCINYEIFKDWWKQNYEADQPEGSTVSIEDGDFDVHTEVNPEKGLIEYTITQGDKSAVIKLGEKANTFMFCNIRKAGRILLERSKLKDCGDLLHKCKIHELLG